MRHGKILRTVFSSAFAILRFVWLTKEIYTVSFLVILRKPLIRRENDFLEITEGYQQSALRMVENRGTYYAIAISKLWAIPCFIRTKKLDSSTYVPIPLS